MMKVPGGKANHFAISLKQQRGAVYDVSFDVIGSSRGTLSVAFGGTHGAPISGRNPSAHMRRFTVDGSGDLWFVATPDFDGAITNILVREVAERVPASLTPVFDNGVLRLEGQSGRAELKGFRSNWSTHVSAVVSAGSPTRLVYLLWPNRSLQPYIDGRRVEWIRLGGWPAYLDLPAGDHVFELRFSSPWGSALLVGSLLYLVIVVLGFVASLRLRGARARIPARVELQRYAAPVATILGWARRQFTRGRAA
jgi:hypothetical protein